MLDRRDLLALSVWDGAPRRRLAALLHALAGQMPLSARASQQTLDPSGQPGTCPTEPTSPSLEELLAWMDPSVDPATLAALLRREADRAVDRAATAGITVIEWGSADYPPLLAAIPDPPPILWVRGSAAVLAHLSVAIVGSRAASHYGLEVAAELAHGLAAAGVVVVSGLARGVDGAAHRGALSGGGATVAVLGCGVDVTYPPEHARLTDEVVDRGAVVSEYRPGTAPYAFLFPMRNRIISGLARGVVIVEAAERSGSLITAAAALEQGREVMAVPGSVLNERHRGAHGLIRDGATLVTGAAEVLAVLGRLPFPADQRTRRAGPTGDPVLDALPHGDACDLDTIAARTGLDPPALLARLLGLEMAGVVGRAEGGLFVRVGRTC